MRKRELAALVICGVLFLGLLTAWAVGEREQVTENTENWDYKPHLTLGDTTYWASTTGMKSRLPDGYIECAQITEMVPGLADKSGQSNCHSPGTPVYHNPAHPGWVYAPVDGDDYCVRYTVIELQKSFLRYNGKLYLRALDIPYEIDANTAFSVKRLEPVAEELIRAASETIPMEDGTITRDFNATARLLRDPEKPELLIVGDGAKQETYTPYVTLESLGLDYSAWEWQ